MAAHAFAQLAGNAHDCMRLIMSCLVGRGYQFISVLLQQIQLDRISMDAKDRAGAGHKP